MMNEDFQDTLKEKNGHNKSCILYIYTSVIKFQPAINNKVEFSVKFCDKKKI